MKQFSPGKQAIIDALKAATNTLAFRNKIGRNVLEENKRFLEEKKRLELTQEEKLHIYNSCDGK